MLHKIWVGDRSEHSHQTYENRWLSFVVIDPKSQCATLHAVEMLTLDLHQETPIRVRAAGACLTPRLCELSRWNHSFLLLVRNY